VQNAKELAATALADGKKTMVSAKQLLFEKMNK
jgi:hypothetical protein